MNKITVLWFSVHNIYSSVERYEELTQRTQRLHRGALRKNLLV